VEVFPAGVSGWQGVGAGFFAVKELDEIWSYIAEYNPNRADSFIDFIDRKLSPCCTESRSLSVFLSWKSIRREQSRNAAT
jgi:hypothetical protein